MVSWVTCRPQEPRDYWVGFGLVGPGVVCELVEPDDIGAAPELAGAMAPPLFIEPSLFIALL